MAEPAPMQTTAYRTTMRRFPCVRCGARLEYAPGTKELKCSFCGADNTIAAPQNVVEELDYRTAVSDLENKAPMQVKQTVRCEGCQSELDPPEGVTSFACPFCGSNIVATMSKATSHILPGALLPFQLKRDEAIAKFREWRGSRWFAPTALKREGYIDAGFTGTYLPAWTYDAHTRTSYDGARGDAYYVTETYTINNQRQTRQVRKIRWTPVSGVVSNAFDDVLVMASKSLPEDRLEQLMPWDLQAVVPYDDSYLAGFRSEVYTVGLPEGFEAAKGLMEPVIVSSIRHDIGGDEQRIGSMNTAYSNVTFKHILLPIWISAYRYNNRVYQFMVNARTGEVTGQRPYSALKITLFVLMCLVIVGIIIALVAAKR